MSDKKRKKAMDAEITNTLLDDFDKFEHFAMTHWKLIFTVCILIVIGVGVVMYVLQYTENARNEAISAIAAAKTEPELKKVIADFAKYPQTIDARMRLAVLLRKNKKYAEAGEQYSILLKSDIPAELRYRLKLDIAYIEELSGKKEQSAGSFAKIANDSFCLEAFRAEAAYAAGRIYADIGKIAESEKYLKRAAGKKAGIQRDSLWQRQAILMLERIKDKKITPAAGEKKKS